MDTRNGSSVWEATSSGPAARAMPSPALLIRVDARSQRKLRPSLAGATVSVIRAGKDRTGGRIPTTEVERSGSPTPMTFWRRGSQH
jgi:hypothetical protein